MSKARRFFIDYLMVPVLIPVFSAAAAAYYVNQETEDYTYLSYAWAWPHANEHTRQLIREAMADGKISRWESAELVRVILDDVHALMTCPTGSDCRDITIEQAREKLREAMQK